MLDIMLVVLVLVWIGACICCFRASPGVFRRAGISAMGVLVGTLVIWLGGNNVLEKFSLAWRSWVVTCFLVVMILAYLAIPICAAGCMYKGRQGIFHMMCLLCIVELFIGGWWECFWRRFLISRNGILSGREARWWKRTRDFLEHVLHITPG